MGRRRDSNYIVDEDILLMRLISLHLEDAPAGCRFTREIKGFPRKNIVVELNIKVLESEE